MALPSVALHLGRGAGQVTRHIFPGVSFLSDFSSATQSTERVKRSVLPSHFLLQDVTIIVTDLNVASFLVTGVPPPAKDLVAWLEKAQWLGLMH